MASPVCSRSARLSARPLAAAQLRQSRGGWGCRRRRGGGVAV